jgi:hypothetical protein
MKIIDKLKKDRWCEYKELKLDSLGQDPVAFSPGLETYEKFNDTDW